MASESSFSVGSLFCLGIGLGIGAGLLFLAPNPLFRAHKAHAQSRKFIVCPKCEVKNPDTNSFCWGCGRRVYPMRFCGACGKSIEMRWRYCGDCGTSLRDYRSIKP